MKSDVDTRDAPSTEVPEQEDKRVESDDAECRDPKIASDNFDSSHTPLVPTSDQKTASVETTHPTSKAKSIGTLSTILQFLRHVEPQMVLFIVLSLLYLGFRKSATRLGKWISLLEDRVIRTLKMATNTSSL
jgi:hypothetical protein